MMIAAIAEDSIIFNPLFNGVLLKNQLFINCF